MANVHKDFHGALSYGIQFILDEYGMTGLEKYLQGLADTVYAPLVKKLKTEGLDALRDHWQEIFTVEGGEFELHEEKKELVLTVLSCPAITHMKAQGYPISPQFCEHTRILNEAICAGTGYTCSVESNQDAGCCVQRFWKETS
ncbi:MAG: hypothetical protein KAH38_10660 [Candidatus Hydrogenedentes bacterium]|nr:hypothetical protein [Candidatus Hydrogenedentota bacterium]